MKYIHMYSGGKDSTVSILTDYYHDRLADEIVFSEVMFDKKRGISGELPEHIEFIKNVAIPRFKQMGYKVNVLHSKYDYLDIFL